MIEISIHVLLAGHTSEQKDKLDRCVKGNQKCRVYILVVMCGVLTTRFEHNKSAKDMIDVVKALFESSPNLNKHKVLSDMLNTKRSAGSSVVRSFSETNEVYPGIQGQL